MEAKAIRPRRAISELRIRRKRLVTVDAATVARKAGLGTVWKLYRIERAPERARLGDVKAVADALARLEQEIRDGAPAEPRT